MVIVLHSFHVSHQHANNIEIFDPITDDGYAIRIPLNPSVNVHSKWLNTIVSEVYIIIPKKDPPFYMIFEDKNKLSCFQFNGDIDMLSKILDFKLNIKP